MKGGFMKKKSVMVLLLALLLLSGCSTVISDNTKTDDSGQDADLNFNENDLDASYSVNGSTYLNLGSEDIRITKAGTYILEGTLNGSIIIEVAKDEDVRLVLNNVQINADDFAAIYVIEADEVTITLAEGSVNTISDSKAHVQIDDNDVDALIYSKADLVFNGTGTLILNSDYSHGIVSKDDLTIADGSYQIDVAGQGIRGKDSVKIADGNFVIASGGDAIKADSEEEGKGYVYIENGSFTITSQADGIYGYSLVDIEGGEFTIKTVKSSSADSYKAIKSDTGIQINGGSIVIDSADDSIHSNGNITITDGTIGITSDDDGIHADGMIEIDDGIITIDAHEGIEATYVLINGGTITISASDDGINAGQKSNLYTPTVEINDGYITIVMGQGDTDAIDVNGYLYINGGTVNITAQFPFDYDKGAEHNGGTIIVNGVETDEISNQFGGMEGGPFSPGENGPFPPGDGGGFPADGNSGEGGHFPPGGGPKR